MHELKKIGKVFTSKFVGIGPSFYKKKIIYRAAVSQKLRNTGVDRQKFTDVSKERTNPHLQGYILQMKAIGPFRSR